MRHVRTWNDTAGAQAKRSRCPGGDNATYHSLWFWHGILVPQHVQALAVAASAAARVEGGAGGVGTADATAVARAEEGTEVEGAASTPTAVAGVTSVFGKVVAPPSHSSLLSPPVLEPEAEPAKEFQCQLCNKGFAQARYLKTHVRQVHELKKYGANWSPQKQKVGCFYCLGCFFRRFFEIHLL